MEQERESIVWDGSNICRVVLFIEKHVALGAMTLDHVQGMQIEQYGTQLPVAIGDSIVAIKGGVTVQKGAV